MCTYECESMNFSFLPIFGSLCSLSATFQQPFCSRMGVLDTVYTLINKEFTQFSLNYLRNLKSAESKRCPYSFACPLVFALRRRLPIKPAPSPAPGAITGSIPLPRPRPLRPFSPPPPPNRPPPLMSINVSGIKRDLFRKNYGNQPIGKEKWKMEGKEERLTIECQRIR